MFIKKAFDILEKSACPSGFVATYTGDENYNRVWSRDSAITALAIFLQGKTDLYPYVKRSILTLAECQHADGFIPSNVLEDTSLGNQASYGTLVGRVDAQTWWIIQSCLYLKFVPDEALANLLKPKIREVLQVLSAWEFNGRNLIYTPLGGNWADEYVLSGYTLYDNLLRYWSLKLCMELWPEDVVLAQKTINVKRAIESNFLPQEDIDVATIHPRIYRQTMALKLPYLPAAFDSAQYNTQWDAAANGLALLLGFKNNFVSSYVNLFREGSKELIVPTFWPVIQETDASWDLLKNQFNYSFKNAPYQFHNGGSWPVMSGILAMGLRYRNNSELAEELLNSYTKFLTGEDALRFSEFISLDTKKPGGKTHMCFSASGYLFMSAELKDIHSIFDL